MLFIKLVIVFCSIVLVSSCSAQNEPKSVDTGTTSKTSENSPKPTSVSITSENNQESTSVSITSENDQEPSSVSTTSRKSTTK